MTDRTFIPVRDYIASIWPSMVVDLPELETLKDIWMEPLYVETEPDITVATALLFEQSLEVGIPGVDAIKLVIAPAGAATSFMLRFTSNPTPTISLVEVPIALRFRTDLLKPARQKPPDANGVQEWEVDPTKSSVDLQIASVTISIDFDGNLSVDAGVTLNLPPAMIGDTGIVIEAQNIGIFLDANQPPPGKPAGWRGVHVGQAALHLPAGLSSTVGTLSMKDAYIGNGGFTGSVAVDFVPAIAATLAGMEVTLEHAGITLVQNALTASEIRGTMRLPFFDEPVGIAIALTLDGGFALALRGGANGLVTLTKPGVLELRLDSLAFAVDDGRFVAKLGGQLRPLIAGLDWPAVQVQELSIDSEGNVRLEGGWLDLREGYQLNLSGFQFEITKLGLGSTEDGGKWLGFSGGLKLVDGMRAGASVEGLRISWYDDGRPAALTLNGVGVEFEVPGVLRFQGAVSYRELPGGVRRFDGAIRLELTTLNLEIDGQLVIGTAPGYTFLAIYLGLDLPAGIPLWTTGLGLYGLAGLFALNMEPDKASTEPWYGVGPGEGWYKKPTIGVTDLVKWRNQSSSLALGGGVTIGTVADNGFTFAGRMLLAIVFPGPIIFIEGKANLLEERSSLSEDPIFRALAVIDGREGNILVGLDAQYKFADGGEVIDIGGGAEAFFDFDDPMAWHLYLGMRDPRERRIRAEIFHLFEANAYLMLDARQLATGAFVGYHNSWKFGPVRATLEAWIEGHALISSKPVHFHGELWLHGLAELKVFGFGFDIGADARVAADVFDPFAIKIELSVHLGLPWPLPDFDIKIVFQWGPEPTPPALPMPLKEVAIEHFKVTTSWPLPRVAAPALLAPNYDTDADGFLGAPLPAVATVEAAAPPASAPVVPLDARPHVTFGRSVHDDALVGVNPQPPWPEAQPDPGWEWIGDPQKNEGPVRMRTGLKEVALERWNSASGAWGTVARKAQGPNPAGVPTLYGSWAPVPQLPGGIAVSGSPSPPGNTKLWIWSRSAFDYARHTTGQWSDWWANAYADYPCVPIPPEEEICCYFDSLKPGTPVTSPWRCPRHPEFVLGWSFPIRPTVVAGPLGVTLCFGADERVELRLGRTVKSVRLFIVTSPGHEEVRECLDLRDRHRRDLPNPYVEDGFQFFVFDRSGTPTAFIHLVSHGIPGGSMIGGLDLGFNSRIVLPVAADAVDLLVTCGAGPITLTGFTASGSVADTRRTTGSGQLEAIKLRSTAPIVSVTITAPQSEAFLHELCVQRDKGNVRVVGVNRAGVESAPVPVVGGVAKLPGRELAAVRVSGEGLAFCLRGFCVVVGLSRTEQAWRETMAQHLIDETARWQAEGFVLEPHAAYRIRLVTTLETRDFPHDPAFNKIREQTEFAFFRTSGPPGIANLSRPLIAQSADDFESGLEDLVRYVEQTVPPTVPGPGDKPPLPRPVFRAYDTGVRFNEDYVDLLYRISGRDLGQYLYDNNNQPARDAFGRLLIATNRWGRAEQLTLTATDQQWVGVFNSSSCALIDESLIIHNRTLGLEGQVLAGDTLYEARLIPLLLHETFAKYALNQNAIGSGATLPAVGGGWVVEDVGTFSGPSRWVVGEAGTPAIRYIEQQSNIWGGPDVASDPTNPGTILLRASDPALAANHPDQPGNWTDYRITAVLRALDDDAIGLVVRYRGPNDHYLFALDRERAYRRLVRVTGGVYTILAADGYVYELNSDITVSIEAIGSRLRVYQDGELVFDVTDTTHLQGGIGLYCWAVQGARFSDIRVDDFRAEAPVVYRFGFTTSRFTDFFHLMQSGSGETWQTPLPDLVGVANAVAAAIPLAALPAVVSDAEARAYMVIAEKAIGQRARQESTRVEVTAMTHANDNIGLLLRIPEPLDWSRASLAVSRTSGTGPAFDHIVDGVPATGPISIAGWSSAPTGAVTLASESVTLLLDEQINPDGWRLEYRTLPSASPAPAPAGATLVDDPFIGIATSTVIDGADLFRPLLNDLSEFTVRDPATFPFSLPSNWAAAAGIVTQTRTIGRINSAQPLAQRGTHLIGGNPSWRDFALTVVLRTDISSGAIGVLVRYVDENNYYRFSMSSSGSFRRLVKCKAGVFSLLWEDATAIALGQDYHLRLEAVGGDLTVWIDDIEVCAVRDTAHLSGSIALYDWRCRAATFSGLAVTACGQRLADWEIFDVGPLAVSSSWQREGGALTQIAAIGGAVVGTADPATHGAYAITGDPTWADMRLNVRLAVGQPDVIGVAVRWRGPGDHLLLILDARHNTFRLIRKLRGIATTLWSSVGTLTLDSWRDLSIETIGTRVRATLDGTLLVDLHDYSHAHGQVGLFVSETGTGRFSKFMVQAAEPTWLPYWTISGVGLRAAGRRLRIFSGREQDIGIPPVTAEVRRFMDFLPGDPAGVRLPSEGIDLRLIAPDGRVLHARRFAPDAAFLPENVSLLRAADGTALVVVAPAPTTPTGSHLSPGIYRFQGSFRRNNTALDPRSLVLSEHGDTSDEQVLVDIIV